ncbi:glutaminase [Amycolatopsis rubida]|uniref:Glutaminase n=1 Tax=Amycolatopsis rubida TaxID=112413 RepID=A0ABX0C5C4_9PSEU|nr:MULTISPECIES: glutaminase [Amycolatopsis]MYW97992.1 glutaminase [Amycolatopsis rubida]NEC62977.1 glutaminase [Amycolatopsis rubida]OAP24477.1 Thermolabile glutaminase [Amycolatopsis sp. M39]
MTVEERSDIQGQRLLPVLLKIAEEVGSGAGSKGQVADYIPALSQVDPTSFGFAVAGIDGEVIGVGDWQTPFSIQSVSKAFSLALTLAGSGESLWTRVGREPSGDPFNSLMQLEHEEGIPRNPFINAGALVVTDRLLTLTGDASATVLRLLRTESGNPHVDFDPVVAASEAAEGDRNAALAHFMAGYGNLENPVTHVLKHYFSQCSIAMSCRDLATAGLFLARHGLRGDGSRLLDRRATKQINSLMLTCGAYDAAGEFAFRVGLPGKSGVGGGILAVVPGLCTLCVWSPALDRCGNSVAGVDALDRFTTLTGLSVF